MLDLLCCDVEMSYLKAKFALVVERVRLAVRSGFYLIFESNIAQHHLSFPADEREVCLSSEFEAQPYPLNIRNSSFYTLRLAVEGKLSHRLSQ